MSDFFPLREKPSLAPYKAKDVLVLFGELFSRGYANGLVEAAEKQGMTIIRATVGRRDKDGQLRALNPEECATIPAPFINIPLEAGCDLEMADNGQSPVDSMKELKLSDWKNSHFDWAAVEQSRKKGELRFRQQTSAFLVELEKHIPAGANVLFAHLMAGGVPRTKIVMPLMNRVFKGTGERHMASEEFWNSEIGRFCAINFNEVTAKTFDHLIDLSTSLRKKLESQGQHVSYVAYGYHGTEVLINGQYQWQSYAPYLQGWAKIQLEKISEKYHNQGVHCCVYNCPEILTNSSSIFQGVEVPLYPLLLALKKEKGSHPSVAKIMEQCRTLLKDEHNLEDIARISGECLTHPEIKSHSQYQGWPQHSSQSQLETLLAASEKIIALHKDEKQIMTAPLSEVVFDACGYIMLHDSWAPKKPYAWIGHDIVAKCWES